VHIDESGTEPASANIRVEGFLDAHTALEFERQIEALFEKHCYKISVDLQNLNYISSAGIAALMGLTKRCRENDGDLIIQKPTDKVLKILELLGFTRIFTIITSESESAM
jgi:anti-anti-sigma factor